MTAQPAPEPRPNEVEVFWRPGCPFCSALRADLERQGIVADWRNIWEDERAAEIVRSVNGGNETVPTVRVGSTFLTNPTGRQVRDLVLGRPGTVAYRRRRRLLGRLTSAE